MCADLVMAADVIEHFPDPGDLIAMIQAIPSRYVVLSTPERDLIRGKSDFGPPEMWHIAGSAIATSSAATQAYTST
jgi:hypothetical protein